jgi:hypothetical protein
MTALSVACARPGDVMNENAAVDEADRAIKQANVLTLNCGSYSTQGFEIVFNHHYVVQLLFGAPTHYIFYQGGFNS